MAETKYVYFFANGKADGSSTMRQLLGGKGCELAEMTKMGVPVPSDTKISKTGIPSTDELTLVKIMGRTKNKFVRALIEVNITPQKDVGFDNVAERIFSFPEVTSCYLVSGAYDLLVVVEGENLHTVSNFVASKLSPMEGVRGTSTHFLLKKYKEDGQILKKSNNRKRLAISI